MNAPVVVGYDHSPHSDRTLAVAVAEAQSRQTGLVLVHAYHWLAPMTPMAVPGPHAQDAARESAEARLEEAAAALRSRHPGLDVRTRAVPGSAPIALAAVAQDAGLLVVGNRGRGGFAEQLLGSVSLRVLAGAECPVLVVRGESRPTQDHVLLALDIDGPCDDLLAFAFDTAAARGARLTVRHVWDDPWIYDHVEGAGLAQDLAAIRVDRAARLQTLVAPWQAKYPDVEATAEVDDGNAAALIVEGGVTADLVVVGAHRHAHGRHGTRVGPVAGTVLHHAVCPVAVVPLD